MRRILRLAAAVAALAAAAATGAVAADNDGWEWLVGDGSARVAGANGLLDVYASGNLNVLAEHIRLVGRDGNFEFEHDSSAAQINGYTRGTPRRTPVTIGMDDGQDVLSLMVSGRYGQRHDVQQWLPGHPTSAAIDGYGRLRLNSVTLTTSVAGGKVRLHAILRDGTQLVLAEVATRAPPTTRK